MKEIVMKSDIDCEKCKRKAMKTIADVCGVKSVSIDLEKQKIIVIGEADPVVLMKKLRKCRICRSTELVSVGSVKEDKEKDSGEKPKYLDGIQEIVYVPTTTSYYSYAAPGYGVLSDENPNACCIS